MERKSKRIRQEKLKAIEEQEKLLQKVAEIEALEKAAEEEEANVIQTLGEEIKGMCEQKGVYCGVKLSKSDILSVLSLAMDNPGQTIDIPFKLYINE